MIDEPAPLAGETPHVRLSIDSSSGLQGTKSEGAGKAAHERHRKERKSNASWQQGHHGSRFSNASGISLAQVDRAQSAAEARERRSMVDEGMDRPRPRTRHTVGVTLDDATLQSQERTEASYNYSEPLAQLHISGNSVNRSLDGETDGVLPLADLLAVLQQLLSIHEVRTCMRLIDALEAQGAEINGLTSGEFRGVLGRLSTTQGAVRAGDGWLMMSQLSHGEEAAMPSWPYSPPARHGAQSRSHQARRSVARHGHRHSARNAVPVDEINQDPAAVDAEEFLKEEELLARGWSELTGRDDRNGNVSLEDFLAWAENQRVKFTQSQVHAMVMSKSFRDNGYYGEGGLDHSGFVLLYRYLKWAKTTRNEKRHSHRASSPGKESGKLKRGSSSRPESRKSTTTSEQIALLEPPQGEPTAMPLELASLPQPAAAADQGHQQAQSSASAPSRPVSSSSGTGASAEAAAGAQYAAPGAEAAAGGPCSAIVLASPPPPPAAASTPARLQSAPAVSASVPGSANVSSSAMAGSVRTDAPPHEEGHQEGPTVLLALQEDEEARNDDDDDDDDDDEPDTGSSCFSSEEDYGQNVYNDSDSESSAGPPGKRKKFLGKKGKSWEDVAAEDATLLAQPSGPWVVHPSSTSRMCWDVSALFLIVIEAICVPLDVSFDFEISVVWFWITTIFFLVDIALNFVTGYFHDGILIMRQGMIVKNYLYGYFFIDTISTFPWDIILGNHLVGSETHSLLRVAKISKLMRVLRLLRLVKLQSLFMRLEDCLQSSLLSVGLALCKTLVIFALFCHWSACIWGFLGNPKKIGHASQNEAPYDRSLCSEGGACEASVEGSPWLHRYAVDALPAGDIYMISLHFVTGLITGSEMDLSPGFWLERIYVIIMMIISFLICSTIISHIVVIFHKINQQSTEFREKMRMIKEFMVVRKVPITLQVKVKRYLEYQFKARLDTLQQNIVFIQNLSPWLRLELTEHLNRDVVSRHPFFQGMPPRVLKRICGAAMTVLYAPGDLVVQKGQRASCMCFIVRGRLRVLQADVDSQYLKADPERKHNKTLSLTAPSWIGDMSLFKDVVRAKTVISVTHSELLTVMKATLIEVMQEFPKVKAYVELFQRRIDEGDFVGAGILCKHCGRPGHHVADCKVLKSELNVLRPSNEKASKKDKSMKYKIAQLGGNTVQKINESLTRKASRRQDGEVGAASQKSNQGGFDSIQVVGPVGSGGGRFSAKQNQRISTSRRRVNVMPVADLQDAGTSSREPPSRGTGSAAQRSTLLVPPG